MGQMIEIASLPVWEVEPATSSKGSLIVIHEVWGLTDHIKDVAERFGREGYYVVAPNLLQGTAMEQHYQPGMEDQLFDPAKRNQAQPELRALMSPLREPEFAAATTAKLQTLFRHLYDQAAQTKIAVVGFCFGGTYSFNLAVAEPRLLAAVPFYGHADQSVQELSQISCPVMAFYGEQDERLVAGLPDLEERMHEARVDFTVQTYTNCGHAFFNDTNSFAYNQAAAHDAWRRTLQFLDSSFE